MEETLLKKYSIGRDGFIWWIGQVASADQWTGNFPVGTMPSVGELPGMKRRVKIRILGYHTASKADLPDEDLPWAYIMLPTTAGTGLGGMYESANFSGGEIVFGFFLDGDDGQSPIIMGVLEKSSQQTFLKKVPDVGFVPFSGYTNGATESRYNIKAGGGGGKSDPNGTLIPESKGSGGQVKAAPTVFNESSIAEQAGGPIGPDTFTDGLEAAQANVEATGVVHSTSPCPTDNPQAGIQVEQRRLKNFTKTANKYGDTFLNPLTQKIGDVQKEIDRSAKNTAGYMKKIMNKMRVKTLQQVAEQSAKIAAILPLDELSKFRDGVKKALDQIGCVFGKIMGGLKGMLGPLLEDFLGKSANTNSCGVDAMVGTVIGSTIGALDSGIQGALSGVNNTLAGIQNTVKSGFDAAQNVMGAASNAIGAVSDTVGKVGNLLGGLSGGLDGLMGGISISFDVGGIEGLVSSLKSFLSCEQENKCPDIQQSSFSKGNLPAIKSSGFGGIAGAIMGAAQGQMPSPVGEIMGVGKAFKQSVDDVKGAALGVVDTVTGTIDGVTNSIDTVTSTFKSLTAPVSSCNMGPIPCGTPTLSVFGSGIETTPQLNAIVSATGEIIGADIINAGQINDGGLAYIDVDDDCGSGMGAHMTTVLGPVSQNEDGTWSYDPNGTTIGLIDTVVDTPGHGYLPSDNGDVGGNGIITANNNDIMVIAQDGEIFTYASGANVEVPVGSTVYFPTGTENAVPEGVDPSGFVIGKGLTEGSGFYYPDGGFVTAPDVSKQEISDRIEPASNTYPVVMDLGGLSVKQTGIAYNPGDTVTLSGSDSAGNAIEVTGDLKLTPAGHIYHVDIGTATGFVNIPDVTINSLTGAGANLKPYLKVRYSGDEEVNQAFEDGLVDSQVISVVDCVGKFS